MMNPIWTPWSDAEVWHSNDYILCLVPPQLSFWPIGNLFPNWHIGGPIPGCYPNSHLSLWYTCPALESRRPQSCVAHARDEWNISRNVLSVSSIQENGGRLIGDTFMRRLVRMYVTTLFSLNSRVSWRWSVKVSMLRYLAGLLNWYTTIIICL